MMQPSDRVKVASKYRTTRYSYSCRQERAMSMLHVKDVLGAYQIPGQFPRQLDN
jgi:hypothetical protein